MSVKEKLELLLNSVDRNGKKLIYKSEDENRVYIDIDGVVKCIGRILIGENNILYHKYEDERNIFRKNSSWSINYSILPHVDLVHYESNTHDYTITKERAIEFGEFLHFQDTTELKVYVPLQYWEKRHKGLASVHPQEFRHRNAIGDSWYEKLKSTMQSPLIASISKFLKEKRELGWTIYPASDRVFRAFKLCTFEHTKVVILGQDPYHDGTANGLAFGYLNESKKKYEKSLDVIYKEIERDVYNGLHLDHDYTLESWAKQGVFLLNSSLTVEKGKPLSHSITKQNPAGIGWERFTKQVLLELMLDPTPRVFILWGSIAQNHFASVKVVWEKKTIFDTFPHLVLVGRHPGYDLRHKDQFGDVTPNPPETFSGCSHFSQANQFLKSNGRVEIKW